MTETRYARSGDVSIAYRVRGEGPVDVVLVPGIVSHVEAFDDLPGYDAFVAALARDARVIMFDKRGNGLSDRVAEAPSLEDRMEDLRAVLDAVGSTRPVLFGTSEGGPMCLHFAAAHPERTAALILFGAFARALAAPDYEGGLSTEAYEAFTAQTIAAWGTGEPLLRIFGPSLAADSSARDVRAIAARCERASATPTALRALWRMNASIDVRDVVPSVDTAALVLHRRGDRVVPAALSRWLGAHLPHATLVELEGDDHFPFVGDADRVLREVRTFFEAIGMQPAVVTPGVEEPLSATAVPFELDTTDLGILASSARLDEPLEIGRFSIHAPLGTGAMGMVFLATDRDLGRSVALKVLRASDAESFRRFRREAMAIGRLSHPNVVAVHELGLDAATPYIVMEHVPGGPLSALGVVPWRRAALLVACAARGLGAAHARGIVHRDIKPSNLLLVEPGGDVAKVADFGIAKLSGAEPLTRQHAVVGTVGYLSPEQIAGEPADARSDVYALGVTLYRLLTGKMPFTGTTPEILAAAVRSGVPDPRDVRPDVPGPIAELVLRMGAMAPASRPLDGAEAAIAIDAAVSACSTRARG